MVKLVPDDADFALQPRRALSSEPARRSRLSSISGLPRNSIPRWPRRIFSSSTCSAQPAAQEEAKPELEIFQRLKKQQEGAAIPEDVEWSMYAEVYDIMADTPAPDKPVRS